MPLFFSLHPPFLLYPHLPMTARPRPGSAGEQPNEPPVAAVLTRRARNAAKRLKRVDEIEKMAEAGKELNEDQVRREEGREGMFDGDGVVSGFACYGVGPGRGFPGAAWRRLAHREIACRQRAPALFDGGMCSRGATTSRALPTSPSLLCEVTSSLRDYTSAVMSWGLGSAEQT